MNFQSLVIVLMAGITVIGGSILIAMLVLESPWGLRGWFRSRPTPFRRLRGRPRQNWPREKALTEETLEAEENQRRRRGRVPNGNDPPKKG